MEIIPNLNGITGASEQGQFQIRNNYKFDAMLRAIDFFSQKFNIDMLIEFAGDFVNEILTLGASAVFIYNEDADVFEITKKRLYDSVIKQVPNTRKLQDMAKLYGTIITRNFTLFLSDEFIDDYKPALLIPLIRSNELMGFIVSNGKAIGEFDEDDFSMATAIMHLFNNAFERNQNLEELSYKEKKLDDKVFELFTVNKASKVLFSEINLKNLLKVGVEIFSEISGSLVTAFGTTNTNINGLVVKSYKDSRNGARGPKGLVLEFADDLEFQPEKYIFHLDNEMETLRKIFKNPEKFSELDAEYVVLIVRDRILGFVTLGKVKMGARYTEEVMELINSLAISCFIALNNAILFSELSRQKAEIEQRYNELLKLV